MQNIWKKLSVQFLRYTYTIELLGSMSTDEARRHLRTLTHWEYVYKSLY